MVASTSALLDRIVNETLVALEEFGRYNFGDKGPHEVMDTDPLVEEIHRLPVEEGKGLLLALLEDARLEDEISETLVAFLLSEMQDATDEYWDALMGEPELAKLY